ncbi:PQQ-binding-like beta-propeller repeat protein [Haloprofundus halobius]|uniref:outer membrane protein assembly factor BamB family protein n=1 Tax=Haloprofundus halobius TaxID=2876194 RepID=UPI001CCEC447|nr:PQQ-binding-like beta-propeller repeat protein [Haloprofundus halobius]
MSSPLTRRNILRAGGLALASGLAGCASDTDDTTSITPSESPTSSPTASSPTSTPTRPDHAAWTYDLDGKTGLAPTLIEDTLYVGRADGQFVALNPLSGDELWSTNAGVGFFGDTGATPTVADGTVYLIPGARSGIAGRGFDTVALNSETGEKLWSQSIDETSFLTLLGVEEGHVLVATSDDYFTNEGQKLLSLNPASGDVQWTAEVGDPLRWAIGAGGVYVAAHRGMRAISLTDGSQRWSKQTRLDSNIEVAADTVILSVGQSGTSQLLGLDSVSGDVRWDGLDWRVTTHAASPDGVLYAGGERVGAYDPATGEEHWSIRGQGFVDAPPIGGRLVVRLDDGIHARNPTSGELLWGTSAKMDSTLALGESLIAYVASVSDAAVSPTLVARNASTGETAFADTLEDTEELTSPVVRGNTVYTATRAGRVYAFER